MGEERFVDTKGVTKSCKLKKDRNTLAKTKRTRRTNNDLQYNTKKTKVAMF